MEDKKDLDKLLKDKLEGLHFDIEPTHWEMMQERMRMEGLDNTPDTFDTAIKGKLENIAPEYMPLSWELMKDAMAADGMEVEPDLVDDVIKGKLTDLSPAFVPGDWDKMKEAIDADGMNTQPDLVDAILKGKLENIQYAYNPAHWNLLQDKITAETYADAKQVDEVLFDASAYGQLSNVEVPYNEEHWELMKERIDAEFSIRGKLVRYKVAEVALILMIIITAFNYLPIHKKNKLNKAIIADTEKIESQYNETANSSNEIDVSKTKEITSLAETSKVVDNKEEKLADTMSEEAIQATSTGIVTTTIIANNTPTTFTDSPVQGFSGNGNDIVTGAPTTFQDQPIAKVSQSSLALVEAGKEVKTMVDETITTAKNALANALAEVETVQTLQASLLDIEKGEENVGCSTCTEIPQKWGLSVGMVGAFDMNHVMTPYDLVFDKSAYAQTSLGYGGGFLVGFRYNKWEVETGAIYSAKQYRPKPRIEIFTGNLATGYIGESINDIELNMVKVPLNLKYHLRQKGKWNIYATGGGTLNMAMQANYDKKQYLFGGTTGPGGGLNPQPIGQVVVSETTAKKRFADGILEGGSFIENRYFSANLGFGVERKFTPRWSIFSQPTYQHQLLSSGLGPNKDRINTLSILTGARVTF